MALTYERVIRVISQSPDKRKDFEVNNLLPWFRKKSDLFRNLKTGMNKTVVCVVGVCAAFILVCAFSKSPSYCDTVAVL